MTLPPITRAFDAVFAPLVLLPSVMVVGASFILQSI